MSLVQAKCTQCGGILEVDNSNDAAVCKYCGTPFIVEKAINNYVQNISIQNATITMQGPDINNLIQLINDSLHLDKIEEAEGYLKEALLLSPRDNDLIILRSRINCIKFKKKNYVSPEEIKEKINSKSLPKLVWKNAVINMCKFKWDEKDFVTLRTETVKLSELVNDENVKDGLFKEYFIMLNDFLNLYVYLKTSYRDCKPQDRNGEGFRELQLKRKLLLREVYSSLISPLLPAEVVEKEIHVLLSNKNTVSFFNQVHYKETDLSEDKASPVFFVKGKSEKKAKLLGTYLSNHLKKNYPEHKSTIFMQIDNMSLDAENKIKGIF